MKKSLFSSCKLLRVQLALDHTKRNTIIAANKTFSPSFFKVGSYSTVYQINHKIASDNSLFIQKKNYSKQSKPGNQDTQPPASYNAESITSPENSQGTQPSASLKSESNTSPDKSSQGIELDELDIIDLETENIELIDNSLYPELFLKDSAKTSSNVHTNSENASTTKSQAVILDADEADLEWYVDQSYLSEELPEKTTENSAPKIPLWKRRALEALTEIAQKRGDSEHVSGITTGAEDSVWIEELEPNSLSALCVEILEQQGCEYVGVMDVSKKCEWTEKMIIAEAISIKHMLSIAHKLVYSVKQKLKSVNSALQEYPIIVDGWDSEDWVALDLGNVVVHVMTKEGRETYNLEDIWTSESNLEQYFQENWAVKPVLASKIKAAEQSENDHNVQSTDIIESIEKFDDLEIVDPKIIMEEIDSIQSSAESGNPENTQSSAESGNPENTQSSAESGNPENTQSSAESGNPENTQSSAESGNPENTQSSAESGNPENTQSSAESGNPENTQSSAESGNPENTQSSAESGNPENTQSSAESGNPENTQSSAESGNPENTQSSAESGNPENTQSSAESGNPENTQSSAESGNPENTQSSSVSDKPKNTSSI
ncbi:hypothetical protein BB561_006103 [Smittium simulii]|uniref:Uncharacterized protein n=1 Tax=Smittium simulii TaxID=133385 RepID=A0A2T9Y6G8_9FUNG|nr:hypothetical protein BB561_006103 [Smittium simulii]